MMAEWLMMLLVVVVSSEMMMYRIVASRGFIRFLKLFEIRLQST